jgi:hypothetical protein
MSETHVNTRGAGDSDVDTRPTVDVQTVNKKPRTDYHREYQRQRRANMRAQQELNKEISHEPDLNGAIKPEVEIANLIKSEPEIKLESNSEIPVGEKSEAEKYQKQVEKADAATERLRAQVAAIDRSQELNRQQQQQAAYANQTAEYFRWWQANGLKPDDEQFLLANPGAIVPLTNYVATEVAEKHPVGSAEFIEAGKQQFFAHVEHLREQAQANANQQATGQPGEEQPMPTIPNPPMPAFTEPSTPTLRRQPETPSRASLYSAPVSRTPGGHEFEPSDPRNVHLSVQEVEAAKISGVTPAEYARQKLRYQQAKRDGLVE